MKNNNQPMVSVLMPAYNAEEYIEGAIESILNQTYENFEFIIIDDCSTDNTWNIIQGYAKKDKRIKPIKNKSNLKTTKTLNVGLKSCTGKYIARMDSDDWSYPDRFEKQIKFMEKNSDVGVLGGSMELCDENMNIKNIRKYNHDDKTIRSKLFYYSPFCHPVIILRNKLIQEIGGYNESFELSQDYDLYFRLGQISKFANLEDVLLKYRTSPQTSSSKKIRRQEHITLYTRLKAIMEYGYEINNKEKLYSILHFVSMYIIPSKLKFWIFNFFRKN